VTEADATPVTLDVRRLPTTELLVLYGRLLDELNDRKAVRSRNAPAGDLAETLAALAYDAELAPKSEKAWDVRDRGGRRIQVKARVLNAENRRGNYSVFRSKDGFECCVFVLLEAADYSVASAVEVPADVVLDKASAVPWVNGSRIRVRTDLAALPRAIDMTSRFRDAMRVIDAATADRPVALRQAPAR